MIVCKSKIDGKFNGFDNNAVFALANGQVWQQARYRYRYRYRYRPDVVIRRDGGRHYMIVLFMGEEIEVRRLK